MSHDIFGISVISFRSSWLEILSSPQWIFPYCNTFHSLPKNTGPTVCLPMLLYHYITFEYMSQFLQIQSQRSGVCLLEAGMNELTMQDQYELFNLNFLHTLWNTPFTFFCRFCSRMWTPWTPLKKCIFLMWKTHSSVLI